MKYRAGLIPALVLILSAFCTGPVRCMEIETGLSLAGAAVTSSNPYQQNWESLTRARLQVKLFLRDYITLESHYQATLIMGEGLGESRGGGEGVRLRLFDLDPEITSGEDYIFLQNLDRLWLNMDYGTWGLGLGRQVIGHGPGRIFNPSDIFGPLPILTTYTEYKSGVDALRLTRPFEGGGEVEILGVAHRESLTKGIAVLRTAWEFKGWGLSAYGGYSLGVPTLGLAVSGDLGGAGWYGEALGRLGDDSHLRASAGIDYKFSCGLEILGELYRNGSGTDERAEYDSILTGRYRGEIFLAGRWYSAIYLGYEITPMIKGELTWIQNLGDGSAMITGAMSWDLNDHLIMSAGALVGLGEETKQEGGSTSPGSEFGDYGVSLYVEARLTF